MVSFIVYFDYGLRWISKKMLKKLKSCFEYFLSLKSALHANFVPGSGLINYRRLSVMTYDPRGLAHYHAPHDSFSE